MNNFGFSFKGHHKTLSNGIESVLKTVDVDYKTTVEGDEACFHFENEKDLDLCNIIFVALQIGYTEDEVIDLYFTKYLETIYTRGVYDVDNLIDSL